MATELLALGWGRGPLGLAIGVPLSALHLRGKFRKRSLLRRDRDDARVACATGPIGVDDPWREWLPHSGIGWKHAGWTPSEE